LDFDHFGPATPSVAEILHGYDEHEASGSSYADSGEDFVSVPSEEEVDDKGDDEAQGEEPPIAGETLPHARHGKGCWGKGKREERGGDTE
jgi:hypothetical protein